MRPRTSSWDPWGENPNLFWCFTTLSTSLKYTEVIFWGFFFLFWGDIHSSEVEMFPCKVIFAQMGAHPARSYFNDTRLIQCLQLETVNMSPVCTGFSIFTCWTKSAFLCWTRSAVININTYLVFRLNNEHSSVFSMQPLPWKLIFIL